MNRSIGTRIQVRLFDHPHVYRFVKRSRTLLRYVLRRPHEPDFACFAHFDDRTGLFLDIGANSGVSALSFRIFHRASPILSIEPNRFHEPDLRLVKFLLRRFDYMMCGAGSENATLTLRVPTYRGVPLTGEATMTGGDLDDNWSLSHLAVKPAPGDLQIAEAAAEVRRLDDLHLAPDFVKLDTEGFELDILRGLRRTLQDHEPVLLIEATEIIQDIKSFLSELGYEAYVYNPDADRLAPHDHQSTRNLFFLTGSALPERDRRELVSH